MQAAILIIKAGLEAAEKIFSRVKDDVCFFSMTAVILRKPAFKGTIFGCNAYSKLANPEH